MKVQQIIPLTIQGEGYHVGTPVSFIRLWGCPVRCWFCDTGYRNQNPHPEYQLLSIPDAIDQCLTSTIVISGGEPFTNKDLEPLINELHKRNHKVHIETSGFTTLEFSQGFQNSLKQCWITLSPKTHLNTQTPVNPLIMDLASELKLVISDANDINYYREMVKLFEVLHKPVYFQPEFSSLPDILSTVIEMCKIHKVKLSPQVHKYLGVD